MSTFLTLTYIPRPSIPKNASEQSLGTDLAGRQFRSELAMLSEADESGLSASFQVGHPPFKPSEAVLRPEISESVSGKLSSPQENNLAVPTLKYTAGCKTPPVPEQAGTNIEPIPITYPPHPLSIASHVAENTESQAKEFRRKSRIHFAALCWCLFLEGWNDGSPGPLLPAIQQAYHVLFSRYAIH